LGYLELHRVFKKLLLHDFLRALNLQLGEPEVLKAYQVETFDTNSQYDGDIDKAVEANDTYHVPSHVGLSFYFSYKRSEIHHHEAAAHHSIFIENLQTDFESMLKGFDLSQVNHAE
jgi:hypothetical protein